MQDEQISLAKSLSYQTGYQPMIGNQDINMQGDQLNMNDQQDDDESIYDEFAEISFEVEWLQKIWDITGHLWYNLES